MHQRLILSVIVTVSAAIMAVAHLVFPAITLDGITVALIIIGLSPWLALIVSSIEIPGVIKLELQDLQRKIEDVRQQVEDNVLVQEAYRDAAFLRGQRRYQEAEAAYQKILYYDPKSVEAKIGLAVIKSFSSNNNMDAAIRLLDEVIREHSSAKAYYNRACIRAVLQDDSTKQQWLDDLDKAIKLDSTYRVYARKDDDFKHYECDTAFLHVTR